MFTTIFAGLSDLPCFLPFFCEIELKIPNFSLHLLLLSNQKQPSCKKRSAALEKAMVKKDVKSKLAAKKWL